MLKLRKLFALLVIAVYVLLPIKVTAQSQLVSDPGDVFNVLSPGPDTWVKGNVNNVFVVYDDDQTAIPFNVSLLDGGTCTNTVVGLASGTAFSHPTSAQAVVWNSGLAADGTYCLQMCVSLKNGATPYSACNLRRVTIRNFNAVPVISTLPPADRTILTTEYWQYDVNATDNNGDFLTYRLQVAPSFLSINGTTGLIFTNSNPKPIGTHNVTVVAEDGYGGSVTQSFQLQVDAPPVSPPASSSSSTSSSVSSSSTSVSSSSSSSTTSSVPSSSSSSSVSTSAGPETVINIISPAENAEFKGNENKVEWEASDGDGIELIALYYARTGENTPWEHIVDLEGTSREYIWDVSDLENGTYLLQVAVKDLNGEITTEVSKNFNINNEADNPDQPIQTKPLIINVIPEDASVISDVRPPIAGEFTPPIGGKIEPSEFKFTLDGVDKTETCVVTEESFVCTPDAELALGEHTVYAEIKDNSGETATREWKFTIQTDGVTSTPSGDGSTINLLGRQITISSLVILCIVCLIAFVLFLIPWMLYSLWRKRQEYNATQTTTETTVSTGTQPEVTVNVTEEPLPPASDPTSYATYEDYLASLQTAGEPQTTVNYYPTEATQPVDQSTMIMPPEYTTYQTENVQPGDVVVDTNPSTTTENTVEPAVTVEQAQPAPIPEAPVSNEPLAAATETTVDAPAPASSEVDIFGNPVAAESTQPLQPAQPEPVATPNVNVNINEVPAPAQQYDVFGNPIQPAATSTAPEVTTTTTPTGDVNVDVNYTPPTATEGEDLSAYGYGQKIE